MRKRRVENENGSYLVYYEFEERTGDVAERAAQQQGDAAEASQE